MKAVKLTCIAAIAVCASACAPVVVTAQAPARPRAATVVQLRGALSPHGQWVHAGALGSVWRPLGVPAGWQPYTYGTWAWIDGAWHWRSDFEWGWAAFHYGRWAHDGVHGWVWVPGNVWGPAWVAWHGTGAHVGWAPLAPRGYRTRRDAWCFVPKDHFGRRHVRRVMVRPAERDRLVSVRPARRPPARHPRASSRARPAPRAQAAPRARPAPRTQPAPRAQPAPRREAARRAQPARMRPTPKRAKVSKARPAKATKRARAKPARKRKRD